MKKRPLNILMTGENSQVQLVRYLRRMGHNVVVAGESEYQGAVEAAHLEISPVIEPKLYGWVAAMQQGLRKRRFVVSGHDVSESIAQAYLREVVPGITGFHVLERGVRQLLLDKQIDVFITHNEEAPNLRMVTETANEMGIATLHVPHGVGPRTDGRYKYHDLVRVSKVAVPSRLTAELWFWSKPYNDPDKLEMVGWPNWDQYVNESFPSTPEALTALGLDPSRPSLGIVGSWAEAGVEDEEAQLVQALYLVFKEVARLGDNAPQLIVRPHPGYKYCNNMGPDVYEYVAEQAGVDIVMPECELDQFLCASSTVLSFGSTVNGAALMLGRRCINVQPFVHDPTKEPIVWGTVPGIMYGVNTPEEIRRVLRGVFCDEACVKQLDSLREQGIELVNGKNDGRACERIEALLYDMVAEAEQARMELAAASTNSDQGLYGARLVPPDPASFGPEAAPLGLATDKPHRWLLIPDWREEDWQKVLIGYLSTYRADDPVALVVRVEPLLPEMIALARNVVSKFIDMCGLPEQEVPVILLEVTPLQVNERAGLYTACTGFIRGSSAFGDKHVDEAQRCGLVVADTFSDFVGMLSKSLEPEPFGEFGADAPLVIVSNRELALAERGQGKQPPATSSTNRLRIQLVG